MMKLTYCTLIFLFLVPSIFSQSSSAGRDDRKFFRSLERKMFDATEGPADLKQIDRLWADDFFTINDDGTTMDKRAMVELLRSGFILADRITSDEFKLRRYGTTVIVTGHSTYFKNAEKVGEVRHTEVWILRGGRWQLAGWQGTPISRK